jgi:arylsulfatase A-like enzyme
MSMAKAGLLNGLAFVVAVASAHLAWGIGLIMLTHMPPLTGFAFQSWLIELPLGLVFGLFLCPLYLLKNGKKLHTGALVLLWIAMEYSVTIDPNAPLMWALPAVLGLVIYLLGGWLRRKHPVLPLVGGLALPALLLSIPIARSAAQGGVAQVDTSDRASAPAGAPDVVFVVLDTVRAKSVSSLGYERETTPHLDAFGAEGVIFEKAIAPGTWSLPAHASLFTGHFPSSHGTSLEHRYLGDTLPTLAEAMQTAGYQTLAFTANTHISDSFGLTRGFDWTDQAWITGAGGRGFAFIYRFVDALGFAAEDKGGGQVASNVEKWMGRRDSGDTPAFVFVNFLEAHFPFHQLPDEFLYAYTDLEEPALRDASQIAFGAMFGRALNDAELEQIHQPILDMYDSGVKYSDHLFGRVVEAYRQAGRLDDTVFVVLADHGEITGEHGGHGHATGMYEENLHVPLVFRYPKEIEAGQRVSGPVSTVGVFASLMELAGLPAPGGVQVGSLMPALEGRVAGQPVLSEHFEEKMLLRRYGDEVVDAMDPMLSPRGRHRVLRSGQHKLVERAFRKGDEPWQYQTLYYDLAADPSENSPHGADHPEAIRLAAELDIVEAALGLPLLDGEMGTGGEVPELSAAAEEQLRALGYIE